MQRGVKITLLVVAALVVVVLIVPLFVNADAFRPELESQLSSALGRKVTMGHLGFSLWRGSLVADNLSVAEDPAFGTGAFLEAKSLHIGIHLADFLFRRQVNITNLVAASPEINLISNANGVWNYASLGHAGGAASGSGVSGAPAVTVGKFEVENGSVTVSSAPATGKPFVYSEVNITVRHISWTQAMPFSITAKLPGKGSVDLKGIAGPINRENAEATPFQAQLTVEHFDPVAAGILPASEGIGMVAEIHAQAGSDGSTLTSSGKMRAEDLLLSRGGTPAKEPVNLDYIVSENLQAQQGEVKDVTIHAGPAAAHVTGTWHKAGQELAFDLRVSAPQMPVNAVENLLPAVGIRLPSGSRLEGGTLTAQLEITGTTTAPEIRGPVEVDNTQLAGFDLAKKMGGLKLSGNGANATRIQVLKADVDSTVPQTALTNIDAEVPVMGTATGQGTVTAAGGLDFQLLAKLDSASQAGALANAAASALGGVAGSLLHSGVSNGIPLTITGTTADPVIRADVSKMLTGQNGSGKKPNAGSVLKGLLGTH